MTSEKLAEELMCAATDGARKEIIERKENITLLSTGDQAQAC